MFQPRVGINNSSKSELKSVGRKKLRRWIVIAKSGGPFCGRFTALRENTTSSRWIDRSSGFMREKPPRPITLEVGTVLRSNVAARIYRFVRNVYAVCTARDLLYSVKRLHSSRARRKYEALEMLWMYIDNLHVIELVYMRWMTEWWDIFQINVSTLHIFYNLSMLYRICVNLHFQNSLIFNFSNCWFCCW